MKWDAVGSILKQTKRKHQLTIKTCIKYVDKKSPVMRPNLQPKIYKSPIVALQLLSHVCNYKVQFGAFKATRKISPLEELVGGDLPPSSSQRLTGMIHGDKWISLLCIYISKSFVNNKICYKMLLLYYHKSIN